MGCGTGEGARLDFERPLVLFHLGEAEIDVTWCSLDERIPGILI
jgi:hypothetical protein